MELHHILAAFVYLIGSVVAVVLSESYVNEYGDGTITSGDWMFIFVVSPLLSWLAVAVHVFDKPKNHK